METIWELQGACKRWTELNHSLKEYHLGQIEEMKATKLNLMGKTIRELQVLNNLAICLKEYNNEPIPKIFLESFSELDE